jgi:hypothetical protein
MSNRIRASMLLEEMSQHSFIVYCCAWCATQPPKAGDVERLWRLWCCDKAVRAGVVFC